MMDKDFGEFISFCFLLTLFFVLIKINDYFAPKYQVLRVSKEHGFEVRFDGRSVYTHVTDEAVYKAHIQEVCDRINREMNKTHQLEEES